MAELEAEEVALGAVEPVLDTLDESAVELLFDELEDDLVSRVAHSPTTRATSSRMAMMMPYYLSADPRSSNSLDVPAISSGAS